MITQLKKGALELCVLAVISQRDVYGYELVQIISKYVEISEGTIYPLLKRLKDDRNVETYLQESEGGAARKYYKITENGINYKNSMESEWNEFVEGVNSILSEKLDKEQKEQGETDE